MKNKVNKQIIKALSVGVAASMALQPIAVCAEEPGAPAPEPSSSIPSSNLSETTPQDVPGVADAAQADAEVVSHPASQEVESEDKGGDLQVTTEDANTATDKILVNHAKDGEDPTNAVAGEAGEAEIPVKKDGVQVVDEEGNEVFVKVDDAAQYVIVKANAVKNDTNISGAETDIDNVKKDLIIAESADRSENNFSNAASATVKDIQEKTDALEQEVNNALEQADTLANQIKKASKISEAKQAYDNLNQLVEDTSDAVDAYNKVLYGDDGKSGLMARYEAAQKLLENAQDRYDQAIGNEKTEEKPGTGAKGSVEAAASKVAAAKATVDELADAIDAAQKSIATMTAGAVAIANLQDEIIKAAAEGNDVSGMQKDLFEQVMKTYHAENLVGENATDIEVDKTHDDYFVVTYKDESGVPQTKYFALDTTDGKFLMFEKSADEVAAIEYLAAYEEKNPDTPAEKKAVYKYTDAQGTAQYLTLAELEARTDIKKVGNSYYVMNGDGTAQTLLSAVSAPNRAVKDKMGYGEENKATAISIANDSEEVYTVINGRLVKTTRATVEKTDYIREQQTLPDYYKAELTPEQKKAIEQQLGDKVQFVEYTYADTKETFYQITGSYVPVFKIKINRKELKEYVDNYDGEKKAKEVFLNRIKELGFTVIDSSKLTSEWKWDRDGKWFEEEYYVWGEVTFTGDTVSISGEEFTSLAQAVASYNEKVDTDHDRRIDLNRDGVLDNGITISTLDRVGTDIFSDAWVPYYKNVTFNDTTGKDKNFFENGIDYQVTGYSGYHKKQVCVDYLKSVVASNGKEDISKITYENSVEALKIIQDALKNGGFDVNDENQNQELIDLIEDAQNLLDKYQQYANDVKTVQDDIEKTNGDITTLSNAIKTLDKNHDKKTAGQVLKPTLGELSMAKYFGVSDKDIQEFFGEEHDGKLEDMSIDELSKFLEYLKGKAMNKKEAIEGLLEDLIEKRDTSKEDLKKTIDRLTPDDDNDNDDDSSSSDDDTTTSGTVVTRPRVTPLVAEQGTVLGETRKTSGKKASTVVETVATDDSDDAVVEETKQEETKTPEAPKTETEIADNDTALAATPELEEKGFAWWILLVLAAAAGVSVEEYVRRKNLKAKAEAKDSTKINK